jgi:hypothetical protein
MNKPEIIVKETVVRDNKFEKSVDEVKNLVNSGKECGKTKYGISFIKILNTIVIF